MRARLRSRGPASVTAPSAVSAAVASLLAAAPPVLAQEARIAMTVDTSLIHVGDPVTVRLSVDHPDGWAVEWPDSLDLAPFEVLRADHATPVPTGDGDRWVAAATLVVTSFELGELEIPPVSVPVTAPDGSADTLLTDPFRVGVETVGLDESGDLRDIRGPLSIPRSWWGVLLWSALAAAVVGAVAHHLYRRRRAAPESEAPVPRAPPRPFHQLALEALRRLERSSLLERGRVKDYHVRISEIIRRYIEGQLEVPALELTTREVADGLRRAALGTRVTGAFQDFLERCDLVKFAKLRPGSQEARALMERARELVRMTSGTGRRAEAAGGGSADGVETGTEVGADLGDPPTARDPDTAVAGAGA